jgi:hypothetical protein
MKDNVRLSVVFCVPLCNLEECYTESHREGDAPVQDDRVPKMVGCRRFLKQGRVSRVSR